MKVCDYIVKYLEAKGVENVFGYPGGMILPLMDSLSRSGKINLHITYHEQAAAFAACGYAKVSSKVAVAVSTSGPGATNLITGIADSYFDSVPVVFITGQCNSKESKGDKKLRQSGFQETDIAGMVRGICKYAVCVDSPSDIKNFLELAFFYATDGRRGAVLLDIPMDVLQADLNSAVDFECGELIQNAMEAECKPYQMTEQYENIRNSLLYEIAVSRKPLVLVGAGVISCGVREECINLLNRLKIPVVSTMPAVDISAGLSEYYGFVGVYGHRAANLILSECDVLICLGTRLSIRQTGADVSAFAPNAKIVRVDVDRAQLGYKIRPDEVQFVSDLTELIPMLCSDREFDDEVNKVINDRFKPWFNRCEFLKSSLCNVDITEGNEAVKCICSFISYDAVVVADVGQSQVWAAQSFEFKRGQRMIFSAGHGAMGFALPASVGAFYASDKQVICICGDGGFQMNIQELQFVAAYKPEIKIFIFNNHGLGMIRHFQELNFFGNYSYTTEGNGYSNPDFCAVAEAYGIPAFRISESSDFQVISDNISRKGPVLFEIMLSDRTYLTPRLSYRNPLNRQEPLLDKELLDKIFPRLD